MQSLSYTLTCSFASESLHHDCPDHHCLLLDGPKRCFALNTEVTYECRTLRCVKTGTGTGFGFVYHVEHIKDNGCVDMYGEFIGEGQGFYIYSGVRVLRCVCRLKNNKSAPECEEEKT